MKSGSVLSLLREGGGLGGLSEVINPTGREAFADGRSSVLVKGLDMRDASLLLGLVGFHPHVRSWAELFRKSCWGNMSLLSIVSGKKMVK